MKSISNSIRMSYNEQGLPELTLTLTTDKHQALADITKLKQVIADKKLLTVDVNQYHKKKSLDSNSYCWKLISLIADVQRTSKDEVYIEMLKKYGQREPQLLSILSETVDMVFRATENHCVVVGESELDGKLFKHLAILIGSSQYVSRPMCILIDGIISEAKLLDIETIPPLELERMKAKWEQMKTKRGEGNA